MAFQQRLGYSLQSSRADSMLYEVLAATRALRTFRLHDACLAVVGLPAKLQMCFRCMLDRYVLW